jgi:hypothetical protein
MAKANAIAYIKEVVRINCVPLAEFTAEPGRGHSTMENSVQAVRSYGTTEKDMPFKHQRTAMLEAGFKKVEQYIRINQMPLHPVSSVSWAISQIRAATMLVWFSATGFTGIIVARK